nr:leucine-rich repeat and calponin homology domain-containing protein 1-like [Nerophis lumbriciformis]
MATQGAEAPLAVQLATPLPGHNLINGGPTPPNNRGLERALEEATISGSLNLSARKLKEFPRTAAGLDLSDTVEADLSKNRLSDVPSEVCHLVALETLNLYHNCIRSIPDTVISLHSLTSLNLSRNQLSSLPACLCTLPLRVLNASNNKLVSLPESVGQLHRLMELDISSNELTTLPRHIGRLRALRELNVRRNLLCVLPEDLSDLPLVKLDFSCNKVSTIPLSYRKMTQLQVLRLESNPLQSPPAQICLKGKIHIFKYLSMEACRSDKMVDALYLPVIERLSLTRDAVGLVEDIEQQRKQDSDSGVGSDIGDKRLSATEPSDEDSLSLNVPMSHITEEDGLSKDDSSDHISSLTDPSSEPVRLIEESPTEALREQLAYRETATPLASYIKARQLTSDLDEPLRIDEDTHWNTERQPEVSEDSEVDMISQLKEAVELLQDPCRINLEQEDLCGVRLYPVEMVNVEESVNGQDSDDEVTSQKQEEELGGGYEFQKKRQMILKKARFEAQLAFRQYEWHMSIKRLDQSPGIPPSPSSSAPFGLKPRSAPSSLPCSPPPSPSRLSQASPLLGGFRRSRGNGGVPDRVFLRSHKSVESVDPQFTMRRKMEQLREELELTEQLRDSIESRLKVVLPDDLGTSLMDGVVLCHLANHIRPRSVASIHVPSPAVPKLSMAKCRRNVENFLDACRKIGVPECSLCSPYDIIQRRLPPLCVTVGTLVGGKRTEGMPPRIKSPPVAALRPPNSVSATTQTPPPTWRWWDLIGCSLVHILCLLLLFAFYMWSELT